MEAKLHIDLAQGTLEVEGSETFVREIYNDYKDKINKPNPVIPKKTNEKQDVKKEETTPHKPKSRQPKKETLSIVKDLNLAKQGEKPSLKDFCSQYTPSNNFERNLIFVYYLQNIAKEPAITTDHIFSCYRYVGIKIPRAFRQSLWDTASQKGWINTSSLEDIKLATQGINFIEHDMAKAG
jgi:hypothetical protein